MGRRQCPGRPAQISWKMREELGCPILGSVLTVEPGLQRAWWKGMSKEVLGEKGAELDGNEATKYM